MFLDSAQTVGGAHVTPLVDMLPRLEPLYCSHEKVIVIRGLHYNLNLRHAFEKVYGMPRAEDIVRFILHKDAVVLSRSTLVPALVTGVWPGSMVFPL